ncbi:MAG TPA: asparagine synthase C-terminal domain-containing protein [Gemmatimonadaceae bacterium]|nr:asparagine synthase C-terminal domain-containing protein [Gemmatimonadaceae bacterium]
MKLTPLEIAGGNPLGMDPDAKPLPDVRNLTPLAAFEDAVRAALRRPPCVVPFSGGRDSAAILAVAARIAREESLNPPIAVTVRFEGGLGTTETHWQERVIAHSRIKDWIRITVGDEVDYVGPLSRPLILRYGIVHPPSAPLFWFPLQHAHGGSLLTGFGGDSVIGGWLPAHAAEVLTGRARPRPSDFLTFGYAVSPRFVRAIAMRTRLTRPPWIRPHAYRELEAARVAELSERPVRRDKFLRWEVRLRRSAVAESTFARLAADADATAHHPLHDRRFLAALARDLGARGDGDRTSIMRRVFTNELPDDVLARRDKANFSVAYFRNYTREFARRWDGVGLDPDIVDPEPLRKAWLEWIVDPRAALALQAAWLSSAQRGLEEPVANIIETTRVARPPHPPHRETRELEQRRRSADLRPAMPREGDQSV